MRSSALVALALALVALALLDGCGSGTKTVSVSGSPPPAQTSSATGPTGASGTSAAKGAQTGAQTAPAKTRTAPEPQFTREAGHVEGLSSAVALLHARGYSPVNTSDYHPGQTLRVLIGGRTHSGDGYGQQAFFFVDGRYIGTDASQPSAKLRVVSQSDTQVTLAYPLYRPHDPLCCASGGEAKVPFQLDNGKLMALRAIPPESSSSGLSRY
jgi:LppP/LprE lipoprotein